MYISCLMLVLGQCIKRFIFEMSELKCLAKQIHTWETIFY